VAFYPALWAGISAAILASAVWLRRRGRAAAVGAPQIPAGILARFIDIYAEKAAILEELGRIEGEFRARKLAKHEYRKRRRELESRLTMLERERVSIKPKLLKAECASAISELEVAEAELRSAIEAARTLEAQFKAGSIGRGAYERLKKEYQKRVRSAEVRMEATLSELRRRV